LTLTNNSYVIFYTLDGSDPDGDFAMSYIDDLPIIVEDPGPIVLKARYGTVCISPLQHKRALTFHDSQVFSNRLYFSDIMIVPYVVTGTLQLALEPTSGIVLSQVPFSIRSRTEKAFISLSVTT
jgi:hypothetical protein